MYTSNTKTERLAAKLFCFARSRRWDTQDGVPPRVIEAKMNAFTAELLEIAHKYLEHFNGGFYDC
jgi:hypothetical protein